MLTLSELKNLVALGESSSLEFKKSTAEKERACRTLCAFANLQGGVVQEGALLVWRSTMTAWRFGLLGSYTLV